MVVIRRYKLSNQKTKSRITRSHNIRYLSQVGSLNTRYLLHSDILSCIFILHFRHRGTLLRAPRYETNHRRAAVSSPRSPTMGSRTRETVEAWPWTAATNGRSGFWLLWRTPPQRGKEETSNGFQFQQRRRRWQGENYSLSSKYTEIG